MEKRMMRSFLERFLPVAMLLSAIGGAPVVSEPRLIEFGRFEAVGEVQSVDTGAGVLSVHGTSFQLAPDLVIHGQTGPGGLRAGQSIGYRLDPRFGGPKGLITEIWVMNE
jgi:hypothetical protein